MTVRGSALHKNHNPTMYNHSVISPLPFFFVMDSCLGHILESTKGIANKLGTYIDVNKRKREP